MNPQHGVGAEGSSRPPSDQTLLRHLRGGNEDAATQLYLRYAQRIRALIRSRCSPQVQRRVEPEDLVQSVFRRFFHRVQQGD
jgi:RNA polymerase sigma-70 factor (ECF subfamily)